jgi:uncharacterized membrane protein YqgA involved in biofilm formation
VFLSGTLLNAVAIVVGTTVGLLVGGRMPARLQQTLTDGLGLFTLVIGAALALQPFLDPATPAGNELAILAALLVGAAIGELLNLSDRLDALGDWFQSRLSRGAQPSRISEGFVTASLVFCVGPLTILGSIQNGLTGDVQLLAVKSLLDGVASVAFAAALGAGVYLSAATVLIVQGGIAAAAWLAGAGLDPSSIAAVSAVGGLLLLGVGLRLLEIKRVRVVNFLPALLLAPIFVALADAFRQALVQ